jgi:3-hydroxyisobutyrate dehydrogenase-like beta-hydroxyacid dehydrogenase
MRKVGFIGLGNMGRGMCKNLILKGNQLTVFDINQDAMQSFKGKAALVHSPLEVLKNSEVVFLSLPNSAVVEKIMNEFLNEGVQGKIIVDTSTSYPMSTRSLHAKIKAAGGGLVDSPLIAGPAEADRGELIAVAAGDKEDVDKADDLLRCYCKHYDYVGPSGNGHLIKIAQNFAGLSQALIYAQLYPIIAKYGINPQELYKSLNNEVFSNWVFQFYSEKYINKNYRMDFALELGLKDLNYMKKLCDDLNIPGFLLDGAIDLCRVALKEGKGKELDFSQAGNTMYEYVGLE